MTERAKLQEAIALNDATQEFINTLREEFREAAPHSFALVVLAQLEEDNQVLRDDEERCREIWRAIQGIPVINHNPPEPCKHNRYPFDEHDSEFVSARETQGY